MRELIDRESVLDCFHSWVDKRGDMHTPDEMEEYNAIEALPTIEVVRCKDCKYWNPTHRYCEGIGNWFGEVDSWSDNGFCFKGERRTDEKENI